MQSKLAKSVVMMSLSLVIATSTLNSVTTVEAASQLTKEQKEMLDFFHGGKSEPDYDDPDYYDPCAEVDMEIPLEIEGPSKIVIHDGDKLTSEDLLSKFKSSRRNTAISLNEDKCYYVNENRPDKGMRKKIYMTYESSGCESMCNGFDPTFVDVPQHLMIEANSSGEIVRKKVTLLVKHNTVKKVNKYIYMRCDANLHELPNYRTKNLGKINYGTKVKAVGLVKVGKFNWYKVKYKDKVGYIFADNASDKKLPTLKKDIYSKSDEADRIYYKYNYPEMERENFVIDHNGKNVRIWSY